MVMQNPETDTAHYSSPIGWLHITCRAESLTGLSFLEKEPDLIFAPRMGAYTEHVISQLEDYFSGRSKVFDLEIEPKGSAFQQQVWKKLMQVEYGKTSSYQHLADAIHNPKAVRAVGSANGSNPIALVIPCHRIIGSGGKLTGYAGGLWRKEWLLRHEGALLV